MTRRRPPALPPRHQRLPLARPAHDGRTTTTSPNADTTNDDQQRQAFRDECARSCRPCWLCAEPIDYQLTDDDPLAFTTHHAKPSSSLHAKLAEDTNLRAAHRRCSESHANREAFDLGMPSRQW